jgi:hypothetical protein
MYAIVSMELEKPTRFGHTVIKKTINARKNFLETEINNFIFERQRRENFIRVVRFNVSILNYKKKVIRCWSYTPTYPPKE